MKDEKEPQILPNDVIMLIEIPCLWKHGGLEFLPFIATVVACIASLAMEDDPVQAVAQDCPCHIVS